jgi:hypothetical protein
MRQLWKIFVFFTWADRSLQWDHFEKYSHFSPRQITHYNHFENLAFPPWGGRPLQWDHFEKSLYFSTWTGHLLQWDHFEKSLYFLLGQIVYYNEITLKNLCIFYIDKSPITMRPLWKILCIFNLGRSPMTIWQFQYFWILPIDRLSGTTIPLQKKNLSVFHKYHLFVYKPSLIFLRMRFLTLILWIMRFLALSIFPLSALLSPHFKHF